jgi:transposase
VARPFQIDWRENEETLYQLYKQEKDYQNRTRLHALWLLRPGRSMEEVADLVGVHYRTVQEWVAWYRKGGVVEVLHHRHGWHGGQKRYLSAEQEAELKAKAEAGEVRTIQDGVEWAKRHGVEHTYWGMRGVFGRLELKKKVPRPKSAQTSDEEQEAWKKGGSETNWKK